MGEKRRASPTSSSLSSVVCFFLSLPHSQLRAAFERDEGVVFKDSSSGPSAALTQLWTVSKTSSSGCQVVLLQSQLQGKHVLGRSLSFGRGEDAIETRLLKEDDVVISDRGQLLFGEGREDEGSISS